MIYYEYDIKKFAHHILIPRTEGRKNFRVTIFHIYSPLMLTYTTRTTVYTVLYLLYLTRARLNEFFAQERVVHGENLIS
jgi:hypothetical protein